ncbi:unnamed protein product [Sphagnum troendelagicum]|uniref:CBS domain-containing protein n=1 Tax=Sphagnum troendelagicum TaxID=128251 RepID=A0ABP0TLA1_9BRYO
MNSQGTQGGSAMKRQTAPQNRPSPTQQKKQQQGFESVGAPPRKPGRVVSPGERTVKRLKLSKALTIPDTTTVADACRRMATRRVDAALLTDSNAILCGIITDKDVATRVVAEGLKPEVTAVSKVMTRNPTFVAGDTLAIEALDKMVQGKFRHLPVVEHGEVVALLDITKCLYDAIARMERAAEKGGAIAAAVKGVEHIVGASVSGKSSFIDTFWERIFRPTLGTLITDGKGAATVSLSDTVLTATKQMKEQRMNSVIITSVSNKPVGILTSKDVLMRVVAQGLSPATTNVDKVMTPNPECAGLDTTLVDALHTMHDGKFLHLPVVDQDGCIVACVDVLQLTHGAVATVGSSESGEMASNMLQKFWDSALALEAPETDDDSHSDISSRLDTFGSEAGRQHHHSSGLANSYMFKLKLKSQDGSERNHRLTCGTGSMKELMSAIIQRVGDDIDCSSPLRILYVDDEGDKVLLATDNDLMAAVNFARMSGSKPLTLHIEESTGITRTKCRFPAPTNSQGGIQADGWTLGHSLLVAGAVTAVTIGVVMLLRRSNA